LKGIKLDKFIILLFSMILLAYWLPGIEHIIPLKKISTFGIAGIFFFYGLKLSPKKKKEGLSNWKLHALIQLTTFLIFPLVIIALFPFINGEEQFMLWLSVYFLATLPSAVSSSVVMVSIAKGNIPGAIFNVSLDNSHPLAYGYGGQYFDLKQNSSKYVLLEDGWNVGVLSSSTPVALICLVMKRAA
jgi:predicted Na+-dependent transporter